MVGVPAGGVAQHAPDPHADLRAASSVIGVRVAGGLGALVLGTPIVTMACVIGVRPGPG